MSLSIVVHDVGHGQAVHATTPNGCVVVIDLGRAATFSPLTWLRNRTTTIDKLVITHPHGDHIEELLDLEVLGFNVRQLWRPNWLAAAEVRKANQTAYAQHVERYLDMSSRYTTPISNEEAVENPAVTGGVRITTHASTDCGHSNINNHSGVVVFEYLGLKVVIPGDNEHSSWQELLKTRAFVDAAKMPDVFMASHHGRKSGYYAPLFDDVKGLGKPLLCVVSDRQVPDTDAADRYSYHARGWVIHRRDGRSGGKRFCVTTRADGQIDITIGQSPNVGQAFLAVATA